MKLSAQNIILIIASTVLVGCVGFIGYSVINSSKTESNNQTTTTTTTTKKRVTTVKIEAEDTQSVEDFKVIMKTTFNGNQSYTVESLTSEEQFTIKAKDYEFPSNLYKYTDDLYFRIKFDNLTGKIYEVNVFNRLTQKVIDKPNERKVEVAFNVEFNKKLIKKDWKKEIKLSQLTENQVYTFTTTEDITEPPVIINDIGANVRVYTKASYEDEYEKEFYFGTDLQAASINLSFKEFKAGESINISYKRVETPVILALVEKDDIVYISEYIESKEFDPSFEKYIYNDTKENIVITTTDTNLGVEDINTYTIKPDEMISFNWMIDLITFKKEGEE